MVNFGSIQQAVRDAIAAAPEFAGVTVLVDNGTVEDQRERALCTAPGMVILVPPILEGSTMSVARWKVKVRAKVMARLRWNPNIAGGGLTLPDALSAIVRAVLSINEDPGESRFAPSDDKVFVLSGWDPGLAIYDVHFIKDTVIG